MFEATNQLYQLIFTLKFTLPEAGRAEGYKIWKSSTFRQLVMRLSG